MDIFVSWSGERSRAIAEGIREWLPKIMNSVKPWMSQTDISKGSRWDPGIAQNLDTAKAGIFCLTPSNLKSESILFEAGAISKSVSDSRVYTLLAGVEIADLRWPLAQFQATSLQKNDIRKMLCDINRDLLRLGEPSSPEEILEEAFDLWWPQLDDRLSKLPLDAPSESPTRSEKDLLEEILELVRGQARSVIRQEDLLMMQEKTWYENKKRQVDERARFEEMMAILGERDRKLWDSLRPFLPGTRYSLDEIKKVICTALLNTNEHIASERLENGRWSIVDGAVVVEADLSKAMLGLIITPGVLRVANTAMAELGEPWRFRAICSGEDSTLASSGELKK
ncbi:MAG: toll/interleukin-1 receptor domain-containing protein [Edaphobacter sp.]